jgi:hypothetical protein
MDCISKQSASMQKKHASLYKRFELAMKKQQEDSKRRWEYIKANPAATAELDLIKKFNTLTDADKDALNKWDDVIQAECQHPKRKPQKKPKTSIHCKDDAPGGVVNNDLRCVVVDANTYKCFLRSASCESFTANVQKLSKVPGKASLKKGDDTSTVVVAYSGVYRIDVCRGTKDRPCDTFEGEGSPAYEKLPWPVVRAAIGGIIAGG